MLVSTDEICAGIKDIFDNIRAIAEPAGALSTAGIKKYIKEHNIKNKKIVSILCGANINFHRLRHISERSQIGEKKEMLLSICIPEEKAASYHFVHIYHNIQSQNVIIDMLKIKKPMFLLV